MPWPNQDPAKRQQDRERYTDPEFVRNRKIVLRQASGRCQQCGTTRRRLQVDHVVPLSVRVDHSLGNLRALCSGPGSCHARKTAAEGHAARGRGAQRPAARPRAWW
jgi:5-methylcytosine-specific restriction endonuclease McrA